MLQQTRVAAVIPYYERFLARFPDVASLAAAPREEVMERWAGLGYYARARALHACAQLVVAEHGGRFPSSAAALQELPGIGPSTAGAIAAFCFAERVPILDGNVKRVLARRFAVAGDPAAPAVARVLWEHARRLLPAAADIGAYTQAIMDLGAGICTRAQPDCDHCPVRRGCQARLRGNVEDFPGRREAGQRPVRKAHFLVVVHRDGVLVEQRPARGIWGGLVAPPQYPTRRALQTAARTYAAQDPSALAPRRHGFTHYTLDFTPYIVALGKAARPAASEPLRWLDWTALERAALPAPIRVLLREVQTASQGRGMESRY
jgi:A/G-specific adenine glycosylase